MNPYFKYSSLAFQMLLTIMVFGALGWALDKYTESKIPVFTAIFMLLGVIGSLYKIIRELM